MPITRKNYETSFIDYFDGNLSAEQVAELFLFLESHPDLKSEFENFNSDIQLFANDEKFPGRESLKRGTIQAENIQHYLVASLEGDLSAEEVNELNAFLKNHPEFSNDVVLYGKTKMIPDFEMTFTGKQSLKQPVPMRFFQQPLVRWSIAAILLISVIASAVLLVTRTNENQVREIAVTPIVEPVKKSSEENKVSTESKNETIPGKQNSAAQTNFIIHKSGAGIKPSDTPVASPDEPNQSRTPESSEPVTVQLASTITPKELKHYELAMTVVKAKPIELAGNSQDEKYLTVWEALREASQNNLRKSFGAGQEVLAYAEPEDYNNSRLADVVSKGLEKISNDKVKLETSYNTEKQSRTFSFSLGNFKIEKK